MPASAFQSVSADAGSAQHLSFAQQLAARRSTPPKHLRAPAPDPETLAAAAAAARSAPSHAAQFPVRFVVIENREKLASCFLEVLPADASEEKREKAAGKARKGPMQIAVILQNQPQEEPRLAMENAMTAGAALVNFLNVLASAGFAAKTVSGRSFADPKGLYDPETETLAAFIICGTPDEAGSLAAAPREIPDDLLSRW